MWQYLKYICFSAWKFNDWYLYLEIFDFSNSVKIFSSQVSDKRPINNPIPGRCY